MREVFADTGYWIAITIHTDALHEVAVALGSRFRHHRTVTTETVLIEVLDHASKLGPYWRKLTADLVQAVMQDSEIEVLHQDGNHLVDAITFYAARLDQRWSLTDCMSFIVMRERGITEALAYDRDFEQAGFTALLHNPSVL